MSRLTSLTTHIVSSTRASVRTGGIGLLFINSAIGWHAGRYTSRSRHRRHDLRVMPRSALGTARCSCPCLTAAGTSRTVDT